MNLSVSSAAGASALKPGSKARASAYPPPPPPPLASLIKHTGARVGVVGREREATVRRRVRIEMEGAECESFLKKKIIIKLKIFKVRASQSTSSQKH